jgi:hypothetical protein
MPKYETLPEYLKKFKRIFELLCKDWSNWSYRLICI